MKLNSKVLSVSLIALLTASSFTSCNSSETSTISDNNVNGINQNSNSGKITSDSNSDSQKRPNVVLILADDLGYGDLSINGNTIIETPNIDEFGESALQFEYFQVCPLCAPTRASLLTGKDAMKTGVWHVHGGGDFMNLEETTIAEVFTNNGYNTSMYGKWHSGKTDGYLPYDRGFQDACMASLYHHQNNNLDNNGHSERHEGWTTELLTDMACDYINENADDEFFLFLPYLAPHAPWDAPEEYVNKYKEKGCSDGLSQVFGMIDHLDENVGRVFDTIEDAGISDDTIVIFMSDNGPISHSESPVEYDLTEEEMLLRNPLELRAEKANVYENGTRVPFFIKYGDNFKAGSTTELAHVTDLFPTLLELCDIDYTSPTPLDGKSMVNLIEGGTQDPDRLIYNAKHGIRFDGQIGDHDVIYDDTPLEFEKQDRIFCVRNSQYKLVSCGTTYELYDITKDPQERYDIASQEPEIAKKMYAELKNWFEEIIESDVCYNAPTMLVGYEGKTTSHIPMCVASAVTGNVTSGGHSSSNWFTAGDSHSSKISVVTEGTYRVRLFAKSTCFNTEVAIKIGNQTLTTTPKMNVVDTEFGEITLKPGDYTITLEVVSSETDDVELFSFPYGKAGIYLDLIEK